MSSTDYDNLGDVYNYANIAGDDGRGSTYAQDIANLATLDPNSKQYADQLAMIQNELHLTDQQAASLTKSAVDTYNQNIINNGGTTGFVNNNTQLNTGSISGAASFVNSLSDGSRANDNRLVVSVYATPSDFAKNPNGTALTTGSYGNVLSDGSVALSPDILERDHPAPGAAVYVNGTLIGYNDDRAMIDKDTPAVNTIDIYDKNGAIPQNTLKAIASGQYTITYGEVRPIVKK